MVLNHHTGVYISCQPEVGIQSDPLPDFATALLDEVTLMGISLGGGLVMRVAAFEPRVRRVIADDILTDFFEVVLRKGNPVQRALLRALLAAGAAG